MKTLYYLLMAFLLISFLACSNVEVSTELGLSIEQSVIGQEDENGVIQPLSTPEFDQGETFSMILINVSGFKKGENGLNHFDIDLEVSDPNNNKVFEKKGLLGDGGKIDLPNNIAQSPVVSFTVGDNYEPGNYRIKVSIYDKIGTGKGSITKTFTVI